MRYGVKEARLQIPVLTNRKYIRGMVSRVSEHIFIKPKRNTVDIM